MAKKKTKKPVSKRVAKPRTTRATLEQRNEALEQPKTRKPRAQKKKQEETKVTITEGPATQWVGGSADDFLDTTPVFIPNYADQRVEFTKIPARYYEVYEKPEKQDFLSSVIDRITQVQYWFTGTRKTDRVIKYSNWAFNHPLIFGLGLTVIIGAVAAGVAALMRYYKW